MSDLQSSIRSSMEEKRRRLAELKAKRAAQAQEDSVKPRESREPRESRTSAAPRVSIAEIMNEVMAEPSPSTTSETKPEEPKQKPTLEVSGTSSLGVEPPPKEETDEKDVQVALPKPESTPVEEPKEESESEEEEPVEEAPEEKEEARLPEFQNVEKILHSPDFNEFFNKTSRLVERVLSTESGCLTPSTQHLIEHTHTLYNEKICQEKCVSALQWSPLYKELLLASYIDHKAITNDVKGEVLLWSLTLKNRPEFQLTCNSPVTSATFNKFDHNLVIGGTYLGQIVVWDLRARSQPVSRTPLTADSHSHPIYCLNLVGSQHANNIVSASSDGKVCVWSLSMFNQPTSSFDMKARVKDVGCTAMAFPSNETNAFYMGAEDGSIFQTQLHGSKIIDAAEEYSGHFGPITGLDMHPIGKDFYNEFAGNLMLSSSVDWTVKLWNPKQQKEPLMSFEAYEEYIFDVKWSPKHPGLFAAIDGAGNLDVWNINKDLENPDIRYNAGERILNKVAWGSEGKQIATGNSRGEVQIYTLDSDYSAPNSDEVKKLERQVSFA
mgnify:CR=1 FL=1